MNNFKLTLKSFREMHRLEKRLIPSNIVSSFAAAIKPFVNIWFSAKIIDALNDGADMKSLAILIVLAVGLNFALAFLQNYLSDMYGMYRNKMCNKEDENISSKLYKTEYQKLEDSEFKELIHKHSEAQNRVYSAFSQLSWMLYDFLAGLITVVISVILLIPLFKIGFQKTGDSFFEKPIFLLTIFASIAVMSIIMLLIALRLNKDHFAAGDEYSKLDRIFYYFLNMFTDYKTGKEIRLYNEQDIIRHTAVDVLLTDGEKLLKSVSMRTARSSSIVAVLGSVLAFGIYLFIGTKGLFGLFSVGSLVLYCGSFMQIVTGVMQMANTFGKTAEMLPLASYYFAIMDTEDEMTYGDKELDLTDKFEIEFKNVSFRYPSTETFALKNINLKIHNGDNLAVVGRNGSGKTTFIKLLCRLYDVDEGEILINSVNIKDYTKKSIEQLYSVVFQDFKIFSISVAQNVTSNYEYDKGKLFDALDKANIKERILKMDKKEETYLYKDLEKDGIEISGGEAQKLALARALYKDAPIVILDEPTAALDPIAENEIYSRFNSFVQDKTAIYISHRLSSCTFCTRIAVFDQAKLVEYGSHDELLKSNGKYAELWNAQAKYYV
ncbi:MAG: ABC transporter ATP-binding protein/permease [Faecalibacterium sp.]|nr:ABC transporter ATP-binding protein/permease [Ruminococcus sp.]MCM1391794.1 ABC transporter ATP-binding protein/permease [Ruminococcus sp.]MCM1485440.1 ABC transporter ATP-binding protein/permease [Faecalibacterium sp.]